MDSSRKRELIMKGRLIFYGIPVGNNYAKDIPIVGNKSLAQIAINRINSIAKNAEEFKYMTDVVIQFLKEIKDNGDIVQRIKFDVPHKGLTDDKGFLIKPNKKLHFLN